MNETSSKWRSGKIILGGDLELVYSLDIILLLVEPTLLPFHPIELIGVEFAFQFAELSHNKIGFFFELIDPAQLCPQFIDLNGFFVLIVHEFFYSLIHFFDEFLIILGLFWDHVQLKFKFLDLAAFLLDGPSQIIKYIGINILILLGASDILADIFSLHTD